MPLTSSLYVPGKLVNPDSLLVDVGTGFYVKKTREAAGEVMHTKLTFVKDKADQLQYLVEQKAQQMQQVTTSACTSCTPSPLVRPTSPLCPLCSQLCLRRCRHTKLHRRLGALAQPLPRARHSTLELLVLACAMQL